MLVQGIWILCIRLLIFVLCSTHKISDEMTWRRDQALHVSVSSFQQGYCSIDRDTPVRLFGWGSVGWPRKTGRVSRWAGFFGVLSRKKISAKSLLFINIIYFPHMLGYYMAGLYIYLSGGDNVLILSRGVYYYERNSGQVFRQAGGMGVRKGRLG